MKHLFNACCVFKYATIFTWVYVQITAVTQQVSTSLLKNMNNMISFERLSLNDIFNYLVSLKFQK